MSTVFRKGNFIPPGGVEVLHVFLPESFICRAIVTFGLNALYGRHKIKRGVWGGDWDPSNTKDLMAYTISKGYQIDSWEFGMDR